MRAIRRSLHVVVLFTVVSSLVSVSPAAEPLKLDQVVTLVKFLDENQVAEKIAANGVAFAADAGNLDRLRSAGASDAVLEAIKKAASTTKSAGKLVSYDDVKNMLAAGIPEPNILKLLDNSPTLFTLGAAQERELRALQASDTLIARLQGGGRNPSRTNTEITHLAIVFDCSGSMKEHTSDGKAKIDVAKTVVADLVERIPNGLGLTFVIYGHDAALKCQAVKVVHSTEALTPDSKSGLRSLIGRFRPVGQTPITLALRTAGRELDKQPGGCGLVLISDGKETCQGDPVAEIEALAGRLPLEFGAHVIGFDVDADGQRQLDAVAEAGGGEYYNATNTKELSEAVEELGRKIVDVAAPESRGAIDLAFGGTPGKAGAYFHDAGLIVSDKEYTGTLAMMRAHFYQLPLAKGQELRTIAQVQKAPYKAVGEHLDAKNNSQTFSLTIYDRDLKQVAHTSIVAEGRPQTPATPRVVWTAPEDTVAYVVISASGNHRANGAANEVYLDDGRPEPSKYKLRARITGGTEIASAAQPVPRQDVAPGNNFQTAGELSAPALSTSDIKLGEVRFFKTKVHEGDRLRVSLAPTKPWYLGVGYHLDPNRTEATFRITIYDDDQVKVKEEAVVVSGNPAHPSSAAVDWDAELSGDAWITVSLTNTGAEFYENAIRDGEYAGLGLVDEDHRPFPAYVAVQVTKRSASRE